MTSMIVTLFGIATAIGVHEFGHAFCAWKLGDPTAKNLGRMTPNPLAHLDIIGFLCMLLVGVGFASPVPINSSNFDRKTRKRDMVLVSFSGAGFNILTAIICALIMKFVALDSARTVLMVIIAYNISFASFNLLPLPNLDGWNIVKEFIPYKYYEFVYKYESLGMFVFLILVVTNVHTYLMQPIYNLISKIVCIFM